MNTSLRILLSLFMKDSGLSFFSPLFLNLKFPISLLILVAEFSTWHSVWSSPFCPVGLLSLLLFTSRTSRGKNQGCCGHTLFFCLLGVTVLLSCPLSNFWKQKFCFFKVCFYLCLQREGWVPVIPSCREAEAKWCLSSCVSALFLLPLFMMAFHCGFFFFFIYGITFFWEYSACC